MKTQIFTKIVTSLVVVFLTFTSFAKDWYVNNSGSMDGTEIWCTAVGSNSNSGGKSDPFATLTFALTKAGANDNIYVDAGTYYRTDENLTITQKGLSIIGAGSSLVIYNDAKNGGISGRNFLAIRANDVVLKDFYITGYSLATGKAQAIDISSAAYTGIKIIRLRIDGNGSDNPSGIYPVYVSDGSVVEFIGGGGSCNTTWTYAGGFHIKSSTASFKDYVFFGNTRDDNGGAMRVENSKVTINNSIFRGNFLDTDKKGAAIFVFGNLSDVLLQDSYLDSNGCSISAGTVPGNVISVIAGKLAIKRSVFKNNILSPSLGGGSTPAAGAIGVEGTGLVTVDSCLFSSNQAAGGGKGRDIFVDGGTCTATYCKFGGINTELTLKSGSLTISNSGNPSGTSTKLNTTPSTYVANPSLPTFTGNCTFPIKVCTPPTALPATASCDSIAILTASITPSSGVFYWYGNKTDATNHLTNLKNKISPAKWKDTSSVFTPEAAIKGVFKDTTYYVVASSDACNTAVPVKITYSCPPCKDSIAYNTDSICIGNISKLTPTIVNASNPNAVFSIKPLNVGSIAALDTVTGELDLSKITYDTTYTITLNVTKFCKPTFKIVVLKQVPTPNITVTHATCTKDGFAKINNYDSKLTYSSNPSTGIIFKGDSIKVTASGSFKITASNSVCTKDTTIVFNAVPGKPVLSGAGQICVDSTINLKAWKDNLLNVASNPNASKPWVSSNTAVASVDNSGNVLGKSGGTITITYTDDANCTQTASIQVDPKAVGGTANATSSSLCANTSTTINLTGYVGKIQWQSSSDGVTNWTNINAANTSPYTTPNLIPGTYYYRAFLTSGVCSGTAVSNVVTITVSPSPIASTATITPDTICVGSKASLKLVGSIGNIQWKESQDGLNGWKNITGTPDGNLPICGTDALTTTMYYKATLTSGACAIVESTVLKVVVLPIINASVTIESDPKSTAGELTICPDTKVIFTATPSAGLGTVVYQWKNKGVNINLANKSTYSTIGLKDGDIITCEMTTVGGKCISGSPATSNPIKVTVLVKDFTVKGIDPTSCNLLDGKVYIQGTGTGSVKWSLQATPAVILGTHPGITLSKIAPFDTIFNLGKGVYTITFNNGTCEFSRDVTLTDPNAPQDALLSLSSPLPICQGQSVTITANVLDPLALTATTKYHWKKDGNDLNGSQPQAANFIIVSTEGTYSVTLEDGACSSNENDTIITITPTPKDLTVSDATPIFCKEDGKLVSDLKQLTTNLTQTITWYDAPSNGNPYNDGDLVSSKTYYAEQSVGACKSLNRTQVDVTIIDLAKPTLPGNNIQPTCALATGSVRLDMPNAGIWEITATPVVGSPVKQTTDNLTTNPFTYSFDGLNPGSYTFQIKDVNGCVSPYSNSVVIDQQPVSPNTPVLDPMQTYCASKKYTLDQIKFSPAPTGTVKYYDVNDVAISGKTAVVANTIYKFSFDNGKCESKVKLATTITLDKGPDLVPLVDLTSNLYCAINKPTFNTVIANSSISLPGGYTLLISPSPTGDPILPNTTEIGALGGAIQTMYYNIENSKGCQNTSFATFKFKINEGPKDLVLEATKTYCASNNPTFANLNDAKISGSGTLKWFSPESSNVPLPLDKPLVSGTYYASATVTPGCESVTRQSVVVTVQSFGQTVLDPANEYTFCKGSKKTIADLAVKPYFSNTLVWLDANKVEQKTTSVLISGKYYAAEKINGCISPNTQEIEVNFTSPVIAITPSKLPTCGAGNGVLVVTGADPSYTYQWAKNGQQMTETGAQIANLPDDHSIKYSVVVMDTKGCVSKDTAFFTDCEPAATPHIITPNGDGKNDKFVINYESKYPKCSVSIFNRWGSIVYETKEAPYKDDWDGKPNVGATLGANVLPAGTYFYMIDKGDGTSPESGYVELVK